MLGTSMTITVTMTVTFNLEKLAQQGLIDSSWIEILSPIQGTLSEIALKLEREVADGHRIFPAPENIMRAFTIPITAVKVVIDRKSVV